MQIRYRAIVLASVASVASVACGGGAKPSTQPKTPAAVATGAEPMAAAAGPAFDLSPVAAPAKVIVRGRLSISAQDWQHVDGWTRGAKLPLGDIAKELFGDEKLGRVIARDAPIDLLVTLPEAGGSRNPKPYLGISVGITSYDDARGLLREAVPSGDASFPEGVFYTEMSRNHLSCVLSPSVGQASSRFVCSKRLAGLTALYPYMTRTMPTEHFQQGNTLFAQFDLAPIRDVYGAQLPAIIRMGVSMGAREVATGNEKFDNSVSDALQGVGDEVVNLFNDADKITIGAKFAPEQHDMTAFLSVKFSDHRSWIVQTLQEASSRANVAPEMFWLLPHDTATGAFNQGYAGKHNDKLKGVLQTLVIEGLASQKISRRAGKKAASLITRLFDKAPVSVSAQGKSATSAVSVKPGDSPWFLARSYVLDNLGWSVVGFDEGPTRADKYLRDFVSLYNDPSVKKWVKEALKNEADIQLTRLPKLTYRPRAVKGFRGLKVMQLTMTPSIFPKKMRDELKGESKKGLPAIEYYVLLWPNKGKTWMAFGGDFKQLQQKLSMISSGKEDQTLKTRRGLDAFRSTRVVSGAFFTLAGTLNSVAQSMENKGASSGEAAAIKQMMSAMPNKGNSPMLIVSNVTKTGAGLEYKLSFDMQRDTFDDFLAIVQIVSQMSR